MKDRLECPTCGSVLTNIDWLDRCECLSCGGQWDEGERRRREAELLRGEYEKRTGVRPPSFPAFLIRYGVRGEPLRWREATHYCPSKDCVGKHP